MTSNPRRHPDRHRATLVVRAPGGFRTPIRGHAFAARPPGAAIDPAAGAVLTREPDNPADPLAVAVWIESRTPWRLGYLDRAVAARLAPRLDAGERWTAALDGWVTAAGGWRRPLLAVGRPEALTAVAPRPGAGLWGRPPASARRVVGRAGQRKTA